jgi:hypothetical protein
MNHFDAFNGNADICALHQPRLARDADDAAD